MAPLDEMVEASVTEMRRLIPLTRPEFLPGKDAMGRRRGNCIHRRRCEPMEPPIQTPNDLSQSRIVLKQDSTLIAVIEMSLSSWLVAGIVPGVERQPLKKLAVDESALLK